MSSFTFKQARKNRIRLFLKVVSEIDAYGLRKSMRCRRHSTSWFVIHTVLGNVINLENEKAVGASGVAAAETQAGAVMTIADYYTSALLFCPWSLLQKNAVSVKICHRRSSCVCFSVMTTCQSYGTEILRANGYWQRCILLFIKLSENIQTLYHFISIMAWMVSLLVLWRRGEKARVSVARLSRWGMLALSSNWLMLACGPEGLCSDVQELSACALGRI